MKTRFLSAAALLGLCGLAHAQVTYDYLGAPIAIVDGGVPSNGTPGADAICTVNVPTAGTISDVNVTFQINHTWQGDLRIRLVSPGGTSVDLVNRPGVSSPKQGASTTVGFSGARITPSFCSAPKSSPESRHRSRR